MATRAVLAELAQAWSTKTGQPVAIESVGGVDAAKRVSAGEAFDLVFLASAALDKLIAAGHVQGGRVDLLRSPVALAVRAGAAQPAVDSEAALQQAVRAARSLACSTGPSGDHLARLFERWGLSEVLRDRIVVAPPGVPVGTLVAEGRAELGFQQLSELMALPGISLLGTLPPGTDFITTFSAGVAATAVQVQAARALLAFMTAPETDPVKQRHGMMPARD